MLHKTDFISPRQLTFLTTNTCTAKCDHCSVHSSPERKGSLSSAQMISTIDQLHAAGNIRLVIFAGGEPTLLGKNLLDTIAHADSLGLMTRMVTNAHWATSPAEARRKLIELREAGLREVNISCDDYHTPYIPLQRVYDAWHQSRDLGFDSVVIASASGPQSEVTPEAIRILLGEQVPDFFDQDGVNTGTLPFSGKEVRLISNANISRLGRGRSIPLAHLKVPKSQRELDMPCPWIAASPAVSPKNHLLSCCGMEASQKKHLDYGSLETESVSKLLNGAGKDTMVAALHVLGPYRIMQILKRLEPNLSFLSCHTGICEVCEDIFGQAEAVEALQRHHETIEILVSINQRRREIMNERIANEV